MSVLGVWIVTDPAPSAVRDAEIAALPHNLIRLCRKRNQFDASAESCGDCYWCLSADRVSAFRAALAAAESSNELLRVKLAAEIAAARQAERERDEAREQLRRRCIDIEHLHDERERSLLAERDAARKEAAMATKEWHQERDQNDRLRAEVEQAWGIAASERNLVRKLSDQIAEQVAEVERAFRAGCLALTAPLAASDEVIDRAWARYRQQRAAAGEAGT